MQALSLSLSLGSLGSLGCGSWRPNQYTLWLFNIAMENGPFIDGLAIKNGGSFHGYVSHNQWVNQNSAVEPCQSAQVRGSM